MNNNYKLVPKMEGNIVIIILVTANGEGHQIARIMLPNDNQVTDNVDCINEICATLRKRIKRSI